MSTRGYVKAGKDYYFMRSDAYPSFARATLEKALRKCKDKTYGCVIKHANKIAGFTWIMKSETAEKKWRMGVFCEYGWEIFPKTRKVKLIQRLTHRKKGNKYKFYQKIGNKMYHIKDSDLSIGRGLKKLMR